MTRQAKVLLNATSVVVGGGIQAAVSFIRHVLEHDTGLLWQFALSAVVARQLEQFGVSSHALEATVFERSPGRDRGTRRALRELERRTKPDVVFTFFGPAYVRFRAPHLCGVGNGWVTHATAMAYSTLGSVRKSVRVFLQGVYRGLWYRAADRWLVEEQSARRGLSRRFAIPAERIAVISNGCADHYRIAGQASPLLEPSERFRLLTFAAYYVHKNIEIIPMAAAELARRGLGDKFEFVTTIRNDEPALARINATARQLGVTKMINNVGPVNLIDGPRLYESCDAVFMPSLLETFSATYPEAMAMGLPIITTDLDFARGICGDAAVYYRPKDARAAADAICRVHGSRELHDRLVEEGRRRLLRFPEARAKNGAIVDLIRDMVQQGRDH
ncbi:MAG: glycosyltransferase [Steroidobacteraceae bacterium]|nr:glycosyltransferase [Steroidobacteraceae bacterium]